MTLARRWWYLAGTALALATASCGGADGDLVVYKDLVYYDGPGHDAEKHRLDLYLPARAENFPVLILIHGGGWRHGNKESLLYPFDRAGKRLARRGLGVAVPTYRLAPRHKSPAPAEDVARATRWVYENIDGYGGDPGRIFLGGHSAGGHLAALVALDRKYLAAEGVPAGAIAGVVALSGPYDVEFMWKDAGWFARWYFVKPAFGEEARVREAASAPRYASPEAPPFLILYAEYDMAHLAAQAYRLSSALASRGVSAPVHRIPGKTHYTIVSDMGKEGDETTTRILDFIKGRTFPPAKNERQ